ncbi:response regulator [Streptacidiphilus rugosus]|uniref:response regulator n=1 Tax=Streptacidiphilus rugosus TaxID=405783 RepID=UPI0006923249|nr:response regulator [Streptacidiphilus rugosus]
MTTSEGRILVIDDDRTNRMMLTYRLEVGGLETDSAENGLIGLEKLREGHFDVVLLDIIMPELDGYATLERLRDDPALRDTPVIMMSSLGEMDSVIRCLELGAEDYLPKPLDSLLLVSRVNAVLLKGQLQQLQARYEEQISLIADVVAAVHDAEPAPPALGSLLEAGGAVGRLAREVQRLRRADDGR